MANGRIEEKAFHIQETGELRAHKLNGLIAQGWQTVSVTGDVVVMRRTVKSESSGSGTKRTLLD